MAVNVVAVFPRAGAIGLAVVLLIVSAATIGVINNNEVLRIVRDYDGPTASVTDDFVALQGLILLTQGSAGWLIAMSIGILIAEVIAIVLVIIDLQPNGKLIVGILEIIFSVLVILAYFGTGIASAAYAAAWGAPPKLCEFVEGVSDVDDPCDSKPLTATTALQAVFCFIQIGVFGVIVVMTILGIVRSRSEQQPEGDVQANK